MKFKILLLVLCSVLMISCKTANPDPTQSANGLTEMGEFTFSKIAVEENGTLKLVVSENSILNSARNFSKLTGQDLNPKSLTIETINNKKFLRVFSDNAVSTVELILDNSNNYTTGGTVCSTKTLSSNGGCIPNGEYCTPGNSKSNELPGNCERTTSSKNSQVGSI